MTHLRDVDPVILAMCAQPLDPDEALVEVDRNNKPVAIAPDVEHDSICCNDTGGRIEALDVCGAAPARPAHLSKPRIERSLESGVVLVPRTRRNKLAESSPRDDTHAGN